MPAAPEPAAPEPPGHPRHVAFLLAQVGAEVSRRFAERLQPLGITPSDAACLRILAASGPINQRQVAERMGTVPSRVVAVIDQLESRSLVERRATEGDRRSREIVMTAEGRAMLGRLREVAIAHERELLGEMPPEQVETLAELLSGIAERRGLAMAVPPEGSGARSVTA